MLEKKVNIFYKLEGGTETFSSTKEKNETKKPTYKYKKIEHKIDPENKNADNILASLEKPASKEESLNQLKSLTLEKIRKGGKIFEAKYTNYFRQNPDIVLDFLKKNPKILNLIVEESNTDILGISSCQTRIPQNLDEKQKDIFWNFETILKEQYKQNQINKVKSILGNYLTEDGKKINIDSLFKSEQCNPIKLTEKLKNLHLKDKDGNKLTEEQIDKILSGIAKVKKLDAKDKLEANVDNKEKLKNFFSYLNNIKGFLDKNTKKKEFILEKAKQANIEIKDEKEFVKNCLNYLKASDFEKKLIEKYNQINSLKNKEEKVDFTNKELPNNWKNNELGGFYEKAFKESKYSGVYILDRIYDKLGIDKNDWIGKKISEIFSTFDFSKKSTGEIAQNMLNKINKIKNKWYMPTKLIDKKVIPFLKRLSNNGRELNHFFKNGLLTNTTTIWLYSNNPKNLTKYNIKDFSIAPNTEGKNQITTREKFINVLKNEKNINNINGQGLADYFLKAKIKYGNWNDAIASIYEELGPDTFKKLTNFLNKSASNIDKNNNTSFSNFLNNNKNIIEIFEKFNNFEKQETAVQDAQLILENINNGNTNYIAAKIYQKFKNTGSLGEKKDANLITDTVNNQKKIKGTQIDKMVKKLLLSGIQNQNLDKTIQQLKQNGQTEIAKTIEGTIKSFKNLNIDFKNLNIDITDLSPDTLNYFLNNIFTHPNKAAQTIVLDLIQKGKINSDKFVDKTNDILGYFGIKETKEITNSMKKLLEQGKELSEQEIESILNKINKDIFSKKIFQRFVNSIEDKKTKEAFVKLLNNDIKGFKESFKNLDKKSINKISENISKTSKVYSEVNKNLIEQNKKTENKQEQTVKKTIKEGKKTSEIVKKVEEVKNKTLSQTEEGKKLLQEQAKLQTELAQNGFYTKKEKQEIYEDIVYNTYLDENFRNQIKKQAEKEGIQIKQAQNLQYSKYQTIENTNNTSNNIENNLGEIKNIEYKEEGGLVKIENPFAKSEIEPKTIEAKNIKEGNELLLLSYIKKLGIIKADEINFSTDSQKIQNQFGIDITKPLSKEDFIKFSKKLSADIFFKLEDTNISSIHKKFIKNFKSKFKQNPDNLENQQKLFAFLNDNIDILTKIGVYDFTEQKLNFENIETNNSEKYRNYLRKLNIESI